MPMVRMNCRCVLAGLGIWLAVALVTTPAQAARHHSRHGKSHTAIYTGYTPPPQASFLMDSDTGEVLEAQNADAELHPASLTKTMTLLLTFEAMERGDLRPRDSVYISPHAADMMPSKLGLKPGSSIAAEDAIYAVVTHSANDIAVALAEKVGGNESAFVGMMNRRAQQLGMTHTHFVNASGLHNPTQVSSAHDMAILAHYIIQDHPREYRYFATRTFIYRGQIYENHNHLMETYSGMDGVKTGFVQQSGFNLIASAHRNGHRLIGVIFGGRSTEARNNEMTALLNEGFMRVNEMASVHEGVRPIAMASPASESPTNFAGTVGQGDSDPSAVAPPAILRTAPVALQSPPAPAKPQISGQLPGVPVSAAAPFQAQRPQQVSSIPPGGWAIQIGAFDDQGRVTALLNSAMKTLPLSLNTGRPAIVPMQTGAGWLYRGRITGYNREQAFAACQLLPNCVPVPPAN